MPKVASMQRDSVWDLARRNIAPLLSQPFRGYLPRKYWFKPKDYFIYTAEWITLAASATASPQEIQIQGDSDFIIMHATGRLTATDNTTDVAVPRPVTVRIIDSGSGRQIMDNPVHWDNFFGTADNPFPFAHPKRIRKNSTLTIELTNLEATARHARIALHGFKVFKV